VVILLHRLDGQPLFLNADLIEAVEVSPDTVITLVSERRLVVAEKPSTVVDAITRFRAAVLCAPHELTARPPQAPPQALSHINN
jgi:flagellar protein FlbD